MCRYFPQPHKPDSYSADAIKRYNPDFSHPRHHPATASSAFLINPFPHFLARLEVGNIFLGNPYFLP